MSRLKTIPHRDPKTGQFVSGESFDDIEVVTFRAFAGVQAADLTGGTGFSGGDVNTFEGIQVIDYDEVVDRNEELRLLYVQHRLTVYANSTETEDGTVLAAVEVAADPSLSAVTIPGLGTNALDPDDAVGGSSQDDTIDIIGRPLEAMSGAPFSDTATGIGGAGTEGSDQYDSEMFPAEFGRFHPRDELFVNGRLIAWNIDDAGIHTEVKGQHVYGVLSD